MFIKRNSTNHKRHPYLKPLFWSNPENQFWNKDSYSPRYQDVAKKMIEDWDKQIKNFRP